MTTTTTTTTSTTKTTTTSTMYKNIVVCLLFALRCEFNSRLSSHQSLSSEQSQSASVSEQNPKWLQAQQKMQMEAAINCKSNETPLATKHRGQHALTWLESHNCASKFSTTITFTRAHPQEIPTIA
jgi:hypothetical protein